MKIFRKKEHLNVRVCVRIVSTERHLSFTVATTNATSDHVDQLNEDSNSSQQHASLPANHASGNASSTTQVPTSGGGNASAYSDSYSSSFNKRFKFKLKEFDCTSQAQNTNTNNNNSAANDTVAESDEATTSAATDSNNTNNAKAQPTETSNAATGDGGGSEDEHRCCAVLGCDSSGHLDGVSLRHWSFDTCPVFFGMTPAQCQTRKSALDKRIHDFKQQHMQQMSESRSKPTLRQHKPTQPSEQQVAYFEALRAKLADKPPPLAASVVRQRIGERLFTPELLSDIKSVTTSALLNSISIGINPAQASVSTLAACTPASSATQSKLIRSNSIFNCFSNCASTSASNGGLVFCILFVSNIKSRENSYKSSNC